MLTDGNYKIFGSVMLKSSTQSDKNKAFTTRTGGYMGTTAQKELETLRALPGDDVRQVEWRFAGRYDLQMLVQSARAVARGPVARLVAGGARSSHEWTGEKNELLL